MIETQVIGEDVVAQELGAMMRRARDFRTVWKRFGDVFRQHNRAQFGTQGLQGGKPWAPLSPAYAAWKVKVVGPQNILEFSGRLKRSLTGTRMAIEHYTPVAAEYGTDVEYAVHHQYGAPRANLPKRPPLAVTLPLRAELRRLAGEHVAGKWRSAADKL